MRSSTSSEQVLKKLESFYLVKESLRNKKSLPFWNSVLKRYSSSFRNKTYQQLAFLRLLSTQNIISPCMVIVSKDLRQMIVRCTIGVVLTYHHDLVKLWELRTLSTQWIGSRKRRWKQRNLWAAKIKKHRNEFLY